VLAIFSPPAGALPVLGFQEDSSAPHAIDRNAAALTTVGVDGIDLLRSGRGVTVSTPIPADVLQLQTAHRDHLKAVLVVGNWDDAMGDFSEPLAHRLLGSSAAIAAVTRSLANMITGEGWDGLNVDLESLTARDTAGLVSFLASLRTALAPTATLTVDVQNSTSAADYAANGYNLTALGQLADGLVLMAYDQHGPWEHTPGPVGALSWQRRGLSTVVQAVPAAKIVLGVAGYGYVWRRHSVDMLSDAQTRRLLARHHARPRWSKTAGEWTARLKDGSVAWWSDARSFAVRTRLASAQHLQGLAVWSLGMSDHL
jgi:spore germination protein YaaH